MNKEHACLGLPDAFALELGQGNHTPSPGVKLYQEDRLWGPAQRCRECDPLADRPSNWSDIVSRILGKGFVSILL